MKPETLNMKEKSNREALKEIIRRDLGNVKGKRVLEIGPGKWDFSKKILERNGCKWQGVEPVDLGEKNITDIRGSISSLPFHNSSFDIVLCNQSIEHWFEYGVGYRRALKEIRRVLKKEGVVMINAPIHIHGHPYFLRGDMKRIKRLFKGWKILKFERCFPSIKHKGWKRLGIKGWQSKIGYPDILIPNNKKAYSHLLNVHLKNTKQTDRMNIANSPLRPLIVILRFIKELLLYYF